MAVNYTTNLALGQPVTGTESGTWGDDVNNSVTSYLDIAIAGGLSIAITTTDVTLSITQGDSLATNIGSTTAQYAILNVSGAMTAARNLILPSSSRQYVINNNTTGGFALTVKGVATSGVTMVNGEKSHIFWNGSDYVKISNSFGGAGTFSSITNSGLTTGRVVYTTTGGLETSSANLLYSGADLTVYGLRVGRGAGAALSNNVLGNLALNSNTTGADNVAIGSSALLSNTIGVSNIATGTNALSNNTSGNENIAIGVSALTTNTIGGNNIAIGSSALQANLSGSNNTAVGVIALTGNTTGTGNTTIGYQSLTSNTTGSSNTASGYTALATNTTGSNNSAFGYLALVYSDTGSNNTAVGREALGNVSTASNNTSVGYRAGYGITTGSNNTYLGYLANQSSAAVTGEIIVCTASTTGKGSNTGYINASSGVYQGNNSASWSTTSDQRLKKNIVDNNTGLDIINQIQVRNYECRLPEEITELPQDQAIAKTGVQLGAVAQELQTVVPECVKKETTGVMTVDTAPLTWYLINAVKELTARVAQLEAKGV